VSGTGPTAQEIIATSENGFPWQASLGALADRMVFIAEGRTATANGREFSGPLSIARKSTLGEISFVALGADDETSAHVAAGADSTSADLEVTTMEFENWASDHGFRIGELDPGHVASLRAMHATQTNPPATPPPVPPTVDPVLELRAQLAAESKRIAAIRKVAAHHPEIEAQAIAEGWDETRTELAVLRASRPSGPAIHTAPVVSNARVLEAAACLSLGFNDTKLAKQYGEATLEAAHPLRNIGLRELVAECARLEGITVPRVFGDGTATIQAGFSTLSLPGILENVMNKVLLAAYEGTAIAALDLCAVGSVGDFKEVSRYRLLGTGGFEQVAPDGELKHGKLSEEKYKNKAETYGQVVFLTRQEIINDDLGAFMDLPQQMGRSGAQLIDELFFGLLLRNPASFFAIERGNYLEGAETAFGPDALTKAKTLFRKQKIGPTADGKDQKPINIRPKYLVVPVELETEAELLMGAAQLMIDASGTRTKIPVDNPHRNKYTVISAPHLSDSYFAGASGKAWYLFADPLVAPAFEIVFLNGRRAPVVERVDTPPHNLGMGFRGYLDVGVREQDPRGAVKVKGEV
jgi:hypothetical protein